MAQRTGRPGDRGPGLRGRGGHLPHRPAIRLQPRSRVPRDRRPDRGQPRPGERPPALAGRAFHPLQARPTGGGRQARLLVHATGRERPPQGRPHAGDAQLEPGRHPLGDIPGGHPLRDHPAQRVLPGTGGTALGRRRPLRRQQRRDALRQLAGRLHPGLRGHVHHPRPHRGQRGGLQHRRGDGGGREGAGHPEEPQRPRPALRFLPVAGPGAPGLPGQRRGWSSSTSRRRGSTGRPRSPPSPPWTGSRRRPATPGLFSRGKI